MKSVDLPLFSVNLALSLLLFAATTLGTTKPIGRAIKSILERSAMRDESLTALHTQHFSWARTAIGLI